jgi:hypothetical protein
MKFTLRSAAGLATLALIPLASHAIGQDEVNRIDAFLSAYSRNVNVLKRTANGSGEIISCVDVHRQPGMNHPRAQGAVQLEPSPQLKALLNGPVSSAPASEVCPAGSVEMRLPTRDQIIARGSLRNFLSKYPDGQGRMPRDGNVAAPSLGGHSYAEVGGQMNAIGAQSTINVWRPGAAWSDFSLSQIWVAGGWGSGTQTAEAGTQVYPQLYGNTHANFFIYFTADNYGQTGCYNLSCPAFVQTSSVLPIGGIVGASTFDGNQVEGTIAFYRDPATANWLLLKRNWDGSYTQAGYYPSWVYGGGQLSQYATRIDFGGEVYTPSGSPPTVPMGSGWHPFSTSPQYGRVAYQKQLAWMDTVGVLRDFVPQWSVSEPSSSACAYGIAAYGGSAPFQWGWGTSIFMGGAGYRPGC